MRRYWSHAAMLLLGVSLSVGFYEGRRLVKNTAKALTAATSITASASRRGRDRDRADEGDPDGELGVSAAAGEEGEEIGLHGPGLFPVSGFRLHGMQALGFGYLAGFRLKCNPNPGLQDMGDAPEHAE